MAENTRGVEPYLDEYGVASDLLADHGMDQVARALAGMRDRVIMSFAGDVPNRHGCNQVMVVDGWLYVTDARILVRFRTSDPPTPPDKQPKFYEMIGGYVEKFANYRNDNDCEWVRWPSAESLDNLPPYEGNPEDASWHRCIFAAGRLVALANATKIAILPEVEYLEDRSGYIGIHEDQALQFRFRCGEGCVMPTKEDSNTEIVWRGDVVPGIRGDLRDGLDISDL